MPVMRFTPLGIGRCFGNSMLLLVVAALVGCGSEGGSPDTGSTDDTSLDASDTAEPSQDTTTTDGTVADVPPTDAAPSDDGAGDATVPADTEAPDTLPTDVGTDIVESPDVPENVDIKDNADIPGSLDVAEPSDVHESPDTPTTALQCDDDTDCRGASTICQPLTCIAGRCERIVASDDTPCDDGSACTTNDRCSNGLCVAGPPLACDDANPCTYDGCNRRTGCVHEPVEGPCDDGNSCTTNDMCSNGQCQPGPALDCADDNPCTTELCDARAGCIIAPRDGPCDDGNACTGAGQCVAGQCAPGETITCPDSDNPCIDNVCDPARGCIELYNRAPCDDENHCTTDDACIGGVCVGGAEMRCDDRERCTTDACNPAVGCAFEPRNGSCDDGSRCTSNDTCVEGRCQPGPLLACDDNNPCTTDRCDPVVGCRQDPREGSCPSVAPCTDGICDGGACVASPPRLWRWSESRDGHSYVGAFVPATDGAIMVGTLTGGGGGDRGRAIRFDPWGREMWTTIVDGGWFYTGATTNDAHVFGGETFNPDTSDTDAWIVRTDREGVVTGQFMVGNPGYDNAWEMAILGDDIVIAGTSRSPSNMVSLWVARIDPNGGIVWQHHFGTSGWNTAWGVGTTRAGGTLSVGYVTTPGGYGAHLALVDADGTVAWEQVTQHSNDDGWNSAWELPDGHIRTVGYTREAGNYDVVIGEFDADGTPLWRERYAHPGNDYPWRAVPGPDGGGYVTGQWATATGDMLAMRLDPLGRVVLARGVGLEDVWDDGYGVAPTPDGGLMVCGYYWGSKGYDAVVARVSPWGHTSCDEAGACASLDAARCDDGETCTIDGCDATGGCMNDDWPDGAVCGAAATCQDGACEDAP